MKKKSQKVNSSKNPKRIIRREVKNLGANVLGRIGRKRSKRHDPDPNLPPCSTIPQQSKE